MYGKNGFVTATKFGTINTIFVAATKNFAASAKRFVDRTKHFVVVTKYFCYPYFNKWFCWHNKTFYTVCRIETKPLFEWRIVEFEIQTHCFVWGARNVQAAHRLSYDWSFCLVDHSITQDVGSAVAEALPNSKINMPNLPTVRKKK